METKDEVIHIVYNELNKRQEGISDFIFHNIIKQTDHFLIVNISFTWSLHGWKKQVKNTMYVLHKENGNWKTLI
jgi:hypothetical protein